jgi:hypothetical protein
MSMDDEQIQALWKAHLEINISWARQELAKCRKLHDQERLTVKIDEVIEALVEMKDREGFEALARILPRPPWPLELKALGFSKSQCFQPYRKERQ